MFHPKREKITATEKKYSARTLSGAPALAGVLVIRFCRRPGLSSGYGIVA
jgi:hypothetical protein